MHLQEGKKNKIFFFIFLLVFFSSINNQLFLEKKGSILKINEIKINGLADEEKIKLFKPFCIQVSKKILDLLKLFSKYFLGLRIDSSTLINPAKCINA